MKENNYIRDKEILEESVKQFQTDLQDKSELIRSLRRELATHSSNLYKDLEIKNNELEKVKLENDDLKKQTVILQETINQYVKRIDTLRSEMDKQQNLFDRELDCKAKIIGFHESSSQQKENKICSISEDNKKLLSEILELKYELSNLKSINEEMHHNNEVNYKTWQEEMKEKDQELNRIRSDINQLQQNGISELQLEKMNPIAAATLKVLKSSRGLMEIYSELHSRISKLDQLQLERDRLQRNCDQLDGSLIHSASVNDRLTGELRSSNQLTDELKSRLLSLVTELRNSESRRADTERQLGLAQRDLSTSSREIDRLNQLVRRCLVVAQAAQSAAGQSQSPRIEDDLQDVKEMVEGIKQEAVDADSTLYSTVHELQTVNDSLREENERYRARIELRDDERWELRCHELEVNLEARETELEQAQREASASKSQLVLHEKQIDLMRYMMDLRTGNVEPLDHELIEGSVRQLEAGEASYGAGDEDRSMDDTASVSDKPQTDSGFDKAVGEIMDNKRASDQVYAASIEKIRIQLVESSRKVAELQHQLDHCQEQLKEEKELNDQSGRECQLLRSLNRNLVGNNKNLEGHIDKLKLKLESKVSALAERQAHLATCQTQLESSKTALERLRAERAEQARSAALQEQLTNNLASLQGGALLADHLFRASARNQIEALQTQLSEREARIRTLEDRQPDQTETPIVQIDGSVQACQTQSEFASIVEADCQTEPVDSSGIEAACQTDFMNEEIGSKPTESISPSEDQEKDQRAHDESENAITLQEQAAKIDELNTQFLIEREANQVIVSQLQAAVDQATTDILDWTRKSEFLESQIKILERTRQEMQNENIRLTEEAHCMNISLKSSLSVAQDNLEQVRVQLEQAQQVERSAESVIAQYIKDANEARAKYKRELTLHAADSKLLESARSQIEALLTRYHSEDDQCARLRAELATQKAQADKELEDAQTRFEQLMVQLNESESRNERLYDQLREETADGDNGTIKFQEIIDDLRYQINVHRVSSSMSQVQTERYEADLARLRCELRDTKLQLERTLSELRETSRPVEDVVIHTDEVDIAVVRESNSVLRNQKEGLERALIAHATEIETLTEQADKWRTHITQLSEERARLRDQHKELQDERDRWKDRCTKLVERPEQMDPEQYIIACSERDRYCDLAKRLETELQLSKTDLVTARFARDSACAQLELETEKLNQSNKRVSELELESTESKQSAQTSRHETEELAQKLEEETRRLRKEEGIVIQLREIGRKYRTEADRKGLAMAELEQQVGTITDKWRVAVADAQHASKRAAELETKLGARSDSLGELRSRCDCLEKINGDLTRRLALAAVASVETARKRPLDTRQEISGDQMGPGVKRTRVEESPSEDESDEAEEESEEESEEDEQMGQEEQEDISGAVQPEGEGGNADMWVMDHLYAGGGNAQESALPRKQLEVEEHAVEAGEPHGIANKEIDIAMELLLKRAGEKRDEEIEEGRKQIEKEEEEKICREAEVEEHEVEKEDKEETEDGEVMDDQSVDTSSNGELRIQEEEPVAERTVKPEQEEQEEASSIEEEEEDEEEEEEDESVVVIGTDSSESEKEGEDNEEKASQHHQKRVQEPCEPKNEDSFSGDPSWDQKLIQMVASSITPDCSPAAPALGNRQMATRGRLRRPLRRPNPNE